MRVSRSRKPLQLFYSLGSEILQEVSDAKYLGIQIDNKLDWKKTYFDSCCYPGKNGLHIMYKSVQAS